MGFAVVGNTGVTPRVTHTEVFYGSATDDEPAAAANEAEPAW